MNEKALRILEFNKIIDQLSARATSAPGKALCRALLPMDTLYDVNLAQAETEAAVSCVLRHGAPNFGSNRDFSQAFASLSIGASLSQPELLKLASFLDNVDRVQRYGAEEEKLRDLFECLYPLRRLYQEINRCILSEEDVADDASSELKRIRRSMLQAGEKIHSQLVRMVNSTYSPYLQDSVITMRDDRYCIPVKAEHKAQVPGIVHDQSSSGSTYFIEPAAVVELNNQLRVLAADEAREIEKILASLSAEAAEHLSELKADAENMTRLDFLFAKAALALEQKAVRPVFNDHGVISLIKARHPFIDADKVVPIDLSAGENCTMIVITGPNTGGKTVSLKTAGLLELMGMAGLHIPAADHSELSLFREVYADIGDEQSIEQSLSTFSSHMKSIVEILADADAGCFCLFDELGAGTDPTEGAALAIAILDHLHKRGVLTLATTHYSELKVYAMNTEGVLNASCEFNVETLQPTYRLMIGVPGKSNAFAISRKLGLPDPIIEAAKEQLSQETQDFESILTDLEIERRKAQDDKEEAERLLKQIDRRRESIDQQYAKLDRKREEIIAKANEEARQILQDAKDEADAAISWLHKNGGDIRDMEQVRSRLRDEVGKRSKKLEFKPETAGSRKLSADQLKVGDKVRVLSMGLTGTVHTLPDKSGNLFVTCGIMQTKVRIEDLALMQDDDDVSYGTGGKKNRYQVSSPSRGGASGKIAAAAHISPELNLLGMTTDEALRELDKYLDDARMAHLSSVRIVHGKGTGALRTAVQQYLRKQKWIKSYRAGDFGEGDAGVTIVSF